MNSEEREKLKYILALLRSTDGIFNITLGPEECSLLVKYIDTFEDEIIDYLDYLKSKGE